MTEVRIEENDRHGYSQPTRAQYDALVTELRYARQVIEHVRALHQPETQVWATTCTTCSASWPCPTARAIGSI